MWNRLEFCCMLCKNTVLKFAEINCVAILDDRLFFCVFTVIFMK